MEDEKRKRLINQIAALGIGNIFSIDNAQDLEPIANYFSSQIGVTLAMLADIHHLIATNALPKLPKLMSEGHFSEMLENKAVCEKLCQNYTLALAQIRDEECSLAQGEEMGRIRDDRNADISKIRRELGVSQIPEKSWKDQVRDYVERNLHFSDSDFDRVWSKFVNVEDTSIKNNILHQITEDDEDYRDQLESRI